jgi:hypothetical protein
VISCAAKTASTSADGKKRGLQTRSTTKLDGFGVPLDRGVQRRQAPGSGRAQGTLSESPENGAEKWWAAFGPPPLTQKEYLLFPSNFYY